MTLYEARKLGIISSGQCRELAQSADADVDFWRGRASGRQWPAGSSGRGYKLRRPCSDASRCFVINHNVDTVLDMPSIHIHNKDIMTRCVAVFGATGNQGKYLRGSTEKCGPVLDGMINMNIRRFRGEIPNTASRCVPSPCDHEEPRLGGSERSPGQWRRSRPRRPDRAVDSPRCSRGMLGRLWSDEFLRQ